MEKKEKKKRVKEGFDFSPELIGVGPEGQHVVVDANHYIMFSTVSNGKLFYTAKDNKYWAAPNKELTGEALKLKLPYIRWNYDVLEDEIIEVEREENGKKRKGLMKTGRVISKFPPSPENIAKKRAELIEESVKTAQVPDIHQIYKLTSPTTLLENEEFDSKIDKTPFWEKVARRLNRL